MESPKRDEFDLFISYAHADDRGEHAGKVTALVEAIKADYLRVTGTPLRVFFDTDEIRSMDDWEARILTGLRQSKMMVAILSPSYFASDYCLKEWEIYVETELAQALPGEGISPIYVIRHPAFETDPVEERLRHWIKDLRRRQYIEWLPFWPEGAAALEREDVRRKLADLPGQIAERLHRAAIRDTTPHTVPLPSIHFVGRRDEMHALLHDLLQSQIGAITAVHGIPGIGKSMLAFAYAWGYGFRYPGGRFLIPAANASDLAAEVIRLAEPKGVPLSDEERQRPDVALAKVKAAFEAGPPALLVIDNVDDPALLTAQARERALPKGDHIHVLVTTRISPEDLPRIRCLPLDALQTEDAMALLQSFRPIADSPQDDEWKAALEIVGRLGGHALGVEVVAVYLRENPQVTYRAFAEGLERDGVELMDTTAGSGGPRPAGLAHRDLHPPPARADPGVSVSGRAAGGGVRRAAASRQRPAALAPRPAHGRVPRAGPTRSWATRWPRFSSGWSGSAWSCRRREVGSRVRGRPPPETPAWPACTAWCRTWSAPGWARTTSPAGRPSSTSSPTAAPAGSRPTGARWTSPGSCVPCATSRSA